MDDNFVDLRQNHGHSGLDHSFWPSFTDIMTVIVMIFMLASTVLIVRNSELLSELRATLEAERQAQETSRTLGGQLARLQQALTEARLRNLQLSEENLVQRERLSEQRQQLLALGTERTQLGGELESVRRRADLLSEELAEIQGRFAQLESEMGQRTARLEEVLAALQELERRQQQTVAELGAARREGASLTEELTALRSDYSTLQEDYQRLIRPARSAEGKEVAEVLYRRSGGQPQYRIRPPGEESYLTVSRQELEGRLSALKEEFGQDLYVKIIIPADSGLSYSEAWEFTRTLLNRYDYYFQNRE